MTITAEAGPSPPARATWRSLADAFHYARDSGPVRACGSQLSFALFVSAIWP